MTMPGARKLSFSIMAKSLVARGVNAATKALKRLGGVMKGLNSIGRGVARVFQGITRGFLRLAGVVSAGAVALWTTISKAFAFERMEAQFKVLFGSLERAKAHMADLAAFSAATPFQLADIAEASRLLQVFTDGVLNTQATLRLLGDAAAVAGAGISDVSMWVGRAYSALKAGRPFGEAAQRLQELGLLTGEARGQLEKLQKEGASSVQIWAALRGSLDKFAGGMKELSSTGEGLVSTLKDNVNLALRDFGQVFMEDAKNAIRELINWLGRLREDGTIEAWANKAKEALDVAAAVANALASGEGRAQALQGLADIVIGALRIGAEKAGQLLLKIAPAVGDAIGRAAESAMTRTGERSVAKDIVKEQARQRKLAGDPMSKAERDRRIDEEEERIRGERLRQEGAALSERFGSGTGADQLERGLEAIRDLVKREDIKETPEETAARKEREAEAEAKKAVDDLLARVNERKDLQAAEDKRRAQAQEKLEGVTGTDTGKKALEKVLEDMGKDIGDLTLTEFEKVVDKVGKLVPKMEKKAREDRKKAEEDAAKIRGRLEDRLRKMRMKAMKPEEQMTAQEDHIRRLESELDTEADPKKRAEKAGEIVGAIEELADLQRAAGKQFARSLSLSELFTKLTGQARDGANKNELAIKENTARAAEILYRIEQKPTGMTD